MLSCPACRHANTDDAADCVRCGASLLGATLLGMAAPVLDAEATVPGPPRPEPAATLSGPTLIGGPSIPLGAEGDTQPVRPPVAGAEGAARTLFGLAAPPATRAADRPSPTAPTPSGDDPPVRPTPRAREPVRQPVRPAPAVESRSAAPTEPAAHPRAPGATTLLHQEAAEILAAARIAAGAAEAEQTAAQRRLRLALVGLLLVAAAVALIGFANYRERHRFVARVVGDLEVQRDAEGYSVRVQVETSGPARVELPKDAVGGPVPVPGGAATVAFRLPERALPVGDNQLSVRVVPTGNGEEARTLHLQVRVYYRFVSTPAEPPRAGRTFDLRMELMPGWRLEVPDARVDVEAGGRLAVAVEAGPLLAIADRFTGPLGEFPLRLRLTGPDGASTEFVEALRFPLPETRLTLLAPLHAELFAGAAVPLEGLATPAATVTVGGATTTADAAGRFRVAVPLSVEGRHTLDVEARLEGRAPGRTTVVVDRVDPRTLARRRAEARRLADAIRAPAPPYEALLTGPPSSGGAPIRIAGRVLALRRGETAGVDELQLATCATGCPFWVTTTQPVFARLGDEAVAVGRLVGRHSFVTRDGRPAVAPHLDALVVHARP